MDKDTYYFWTYDFEGNRYNAWITTYLNEDQRTMCQWPLYARTENDYINDHHIRAKQLVKFIPHQDYIKGLLVNNPVAIIMRQRKMK